MNMHELLVYVVLPLAAYLLGSIPFALLLGFARGVDIRTLGSKNIGATNLGRIFGAKYFFAAFFLDALKGFLPTLAASLWCARVESLPLWAPLLTAVAAVLGHLFPLYLGFKGGKGVSTSFGVVLGIWPVLTLGGGVALVTFALVFGVWRYISLASMTAALAFAIAVPLLGRSRIAAVGLHPLPWHELLPLVVAASVLCLLIVWRHRANIGRLLAGTESKMGVKKS